MLCTLFGCTKNNNAPSEQITLKAARKNAQQHIVPGVEARNFQRKNGWQDKDAVNLYKVLYNYEMTLTLDLPEAILELAKNYEHQQKENQKNSGFMGINDWGSLFQLTNHGNNWIGAQEDFSQRRDKFLTSCEECMKYWNSKDGEKKSIQLRRYSYIRAWSHFEEMGFKDEQKKGDGVIWNITPAFMKTENGWMEAI